MCPKTYRYLKKITTPDYQHFVIRHLSFRLSEGILTEILALIKCKSNSFSDFQKLIILCFDEVYIYHKISKLTEKLNKQGPYKTCQISIARGLFSKWKQIIYYGYDQPLTSSIVTEIIKNLLRCKLYCNYDNHGFRYR